MLLLHPYVQFVISRSRNSLISSHAPGRLRGGFSRNAIVPLPTPYFTISTCSLLPFQYQDQDHGGSDVMTIIAHSRLCRVDSDKPR